MNASEKGPSAIFFYTARLHWLGKSYITRELEKAGLCCSIVPSHGDILNQLLHRESCKMTELARLIHKSKSTLTTLVETLTTLVEKLEKNGYVRRVQDPDDQRGVLVTLTDKGRELAPFVENVSRGLDDMLRTRLSEEEMATLEALLKKSLGPEAKHQDNSAASSRRA